MRLSELVFDKNAIVRDAIFDGMGACEASPNMPILTYISDSKYIPFLKKNKDISCVIATHEMAPLVPEEMGLYISASPKEEFFLLHNSIAKNPSYARARFETKIGKSCSISHLAHISEENVIIGNNVVVEEFVSIKQNVVIGDGTIIRAGSIIGGSGFEFKKYNEEIFGVAHLGGVLLGDNVEISHNVCVMASVFPWDDTIIGSQTKIDNLVHIAHACKLGRRNFITAGVIFCGSAVTEDDVFIGPNATIANVKMKKHSRASLGSVVTRDVPDNSIVSGNFAVEHKKLLRFLASMNTWADHRIE